jgi:hypothetical protein
MTKVWGPMGWMLVHSISVCYPEEPTADDKKILTEFMDAFCSTITCIHCRTHFTDTFNGYKRSVPSWLNSRRDLFIAICRLHNTVNKKLDKPYPKTVAECLSSLQNATRYTSAREFRTKYIEYLFRDWNTYGRGTHYQHIAIQYAKRMQTINETYWNLKETSYDSVSFPEENIVTYENQPVGTKILFGKLKLKNFKWAPKL